MFYPESQPLPQKREVCRKFGGLNERPGAGENEFADLYGFCADGFPALTTANAVIPHAIGPKGDSSPIQGMLGHDTSIYVVYHSQLWDNGALLRHDFSVSDAALRDPENEPMADFAPFGLTDTQQVSLVRMGAYLILFPTKLRYNTVTGEVDSLEASLSIPVSLTLSARLCAQDGTFYESYTTSAQAPENPENGALWLDTSADEPSLKSYDAATASWAKYASTFVRIDGLTGLEAAGLKEGDGVTLEGFTGGDGELDKLNGSQILEAAGADWAVVTGILTQDYPEVHAAVSIRRTVPDMDYVVECGNRLWGCYYGEVDGNVVNELYACALGDPTNWNQFRGIASDSYVASRGCDGKWTGAVSYGGYPYFFKRRWREKVYPSSYGAHKIVTSACDGVEAGNTLAVVNGLLYYQSPRGVLSFDGTATTVVDDPYSNIHGTAACGFGDTYFLYGNRERSGAYPVYAYNTRYKLWHIWERMAEPPGLAAAGDTVYLVGCRQGRTLFCYFDPALSDGEPLYGWMARTTLLGLTIPDRSYVSRINLRFRLSKGGRLNLFIRYNSASPWLDAGTWRGLGVMVTQTAVILPRRCDHFELKLTGSGSFTLLSLTKTIEEGSDCL